MLTKKVTMPGLWGVGKTSLVRQFVDNVFDDNYLTTLGVKVDKKVVQLKEQELTLMLWDVAGLEDSFSIPLNYIQGSSAVILVLDRSRAESLSAALELVGQVQTNIAKLPFVVMANKSDLEWVVSDDDIEKAFPSEDSNTSVVWFSTSAKTGENVELAFNELAKQLL